MHRIYFDLRHVSFKTNWVWVADIWISLIVTIVHVRKLRGGTTTSSISGVSMMFSSHYGTSLDLPSRLISWQDIPSVGWADRGSELSVVPSQYAAWECIITIHVNQISMHSWTRRGNQVDRTFNEAALFDQSWRGTTSGFLFCTVGSDFQNPVRNWNLNRLAPGSKMWTFCTGPSSQQVATYIYFFPLFFHFVNDSSAHQ